MLKKIKSFAKFLLYSEFVAGKTAFDWIFLVAGIVLQIVAITIGFVSGTPESWLSIISGLTGIISVVLCAQGKISFYFFGYIQLFTYVLSYNSNNNTAIFCFNIKGKMLFSYPVILITP